jgi:hypothetical protein
MLDMYLFLLFCNLLMSLTIEEQLIWNRVVAKAVKQKQNVSFRYGGLTKAERLELLRTIEYSLDNNPGQPIHITIRKPLPWYKRLW